MREHTHDGPDALDDGRHNSERIEAAAVMLLASVEARSPRAMNAAMLLIAHLTCPMLVVTVLARLGGLWLRKAPDGVVSGSLTFRLDEGIWTYEFNPEHRDRTLQVARAAGVPTDGAESLSDANMHTVARTLCLAAGWPDDGVSPSDMEALNALWRVEGFDPGSAICGLATIGVHLREQGSAS